MEHEGIVYCLEAVKKAAAGNICLTKDDMADMLALFSRQLRLMAALPGDRGDIAEIAGVLLLLARWLRGGLPLRTRLVMLCIALLGKRMGGDYDL